MGAARVVLVAREGWVVRLLEEGLREAGFVTTSCAGSIGGLARLEEMEPDCAIVDAALDERDGYWLTSELRALGGQVGLTPVAVLAADDDAEARKRAFEAGADALLLQPFTIEEVVAQIRALVEFARRMRERRTSLIGSIFAPGGPPSSTDAAAFRGELAQMPVSPLLTLLELERKTGLVSVRTGSRRVTLDLQSGMIGSATIDGAEATTLEALGVAVEWTTGTITFRARVDAAPPTGARPIRALLADLRGETKAPEKPKEPPNEPSMVDLGELLGLDDVLDPPRASIPAIAPPAPAPIVRPKMTTTASETRPAPAFATKALQARSALPPLKPLPKPKAIPLPAEPDEPRPSIGPETQKVDVPEVRSKEPKADDEPDEGARSTYRP